MTATAPWLAGGDLEPLAGYPDHHCFGCGRQNPIGLKLSFFRNPATGELWAPWTPGKDYEGFTGMAHGGIITTVLDEVMGWVLYAQGIWAVTGKLDVSFRKPVEIGVPTMATARVGRDRGRAVEIAGEIRREHDGLVLASASAVFLRVPEAQARAWQERYTPAQASG